MAKSFSIQDEIKAKASKPLLYVAIGSMVMLFAALISAYIVSMSETRWIKFDLPQQFWFSTGAIIISSVTINMSVSAAKKNDFKNVKLGALLTLILGILFIVFQFLGWSELVNQKIFFAGKQSNAAGSFLYAITGLHLFHLIAGIFTLFVVIYKSFKNKYTSEKILGLQLAAIFWHFLDILWVFLFIFLLLVR
ncbi:MAG: cytochrome c oxidase subunit 3 [Bacteroidota bacterium]